MRVAVVGFGLIGGSLARALARTGDWEVAAWSPSGRGPAAARREGVVAAAPERLEDALHGAPLVVLAAPPLACIDLLGALAGPLRAHLAEAATLTDVASTKARIVAAADALALPFVGGHPMAGLEATGFGAARAALFDDRPWVVVPGAFAGDADVGRVERLASAAGGRPERMAATAHDEAVAAISHLPLVVAAALVEVLDRRPDRAAALRLAAGGWHDMTRLARGDPTMGAGIAVTNRGPLAGALRELRAVLDQWLDQLERGGSGEDDPEALARLAAPLEARLRTSRDRSLQR